MNKKILMVVTSANKMPNGEQTGLWLSEFVEPYQEFTKKDFDITVASIAGGEAPIAPQSVEDSSSVDSKIIDVLANTLSVNKVSVNDFDGIFLPGGHGTMFDLPKSEALQKLVAEFYEANKPVGAVCHGPAGLVNVTLSNGQPLVKGKKVTAFTDSEERAAELDKVVPFLLESKMRERGALFVNQPDWSNHVEVDGTLVTGQNPQSGVHTALAFIELF